MSKARNLSVVPNQTLGMKNRIINGAMVIDQRNAGASLTPTNGQYTLDRWVAYQSVASKFSVQQSTTAPSGFINSLKVTSLSAYSVGSGDYYLIAQNIEGFNVADLGWGTVNAKTVTLSFQVYSSLTGTFGGALANSSNARSYPFTYTVSSANTWTTVSVTIAGDTSGTWETGNGIGFKVYIGLGVGSTYSGTAGSWSSANYLSATGATSVVGTNGATFYITGVQLEVGSSATGFEYRQYQQELALCQRYCQWLPFSFRNNIAAGVTFGGSVPYTMRAAPSFGNVVADPASSQLLSNVASYTFLPNYSGANGGYAQIAATSTGDVVIIGYRCLAVSEL